MKTAKQETMHLDIAAISDRVDAVQKRFNDTNGAGENTDQLNKNWTRSL